MNSKNPLGTVVEGEEIIEESSSLLDDRSDSVKFADDISILQESEMIF